MISINPEWGYTNNTSSRDLRFDWMRGYAVIMMIIDHLGPSSFLHIFTGGDRFYTSGAEIFIVISGLITGIVYANLLRRENMKAVIYKAWKRAWKIYLLVIALSALIVLYGLYVNSSWSTQLPPKLSWLFVFKVITLQRTFDFVDIPLIYVFLLFVMPLGLYLLQRCKTWLLITLSVLLWLSYQFTNLDAFIPPIVHHNGVFKFQTWQLLFFTALTIGYHRDAITHWLATIKRPIMISYFTVLAVTVAVMVFVFLVRFVEPTQTISTSITEHKSIIDALFSKKMMGLGRILATAIMFQFVFATITFYWKYIIRFTSFLPLFGQNSLYAYTLHILLIMGFYLFFPYISDSKDYGITLNTAYQLIAVIAVYLMIKYKAFFQSSATKIWIYTTGLMRNFRQA